VKDSPRKIEDVREADFRLANRLTPPVTRAADIVGCTPPQPACFSGDFYPAHSEITQERTST
jgi:hypothetical protein